MLDGVEFVKLSDEPFGASFVLTADTLPDTCAFEGWATRNDHNNFIGSRIQRVVDEWLRGHCAIHTAVIERPINLTSIDGVAEYGAPCVYGRILTVDEYHKYQQFIPPTEKKYWLATPWRTPHSPESYAYYAYFVTSGGNLYYTDVYYDICRARPALYLGASLLVSIRQ